MTSPNPRAWAVATALAAESGLDWGRWARGADRASAESRDGILYGYGVPVPAPWDADAYRADCARRGVEPGPLPSLKYTSPDGRIDWGWLHGSARAYIRVAGLTAEPWAKGWDVRGCGTAEDLALLSRLATAAKRALQ